MPTDAAGNRRWADRAAALYDESYARKYRERDNELESKRSNQELIDWVGSVCDRFDHSIDVLDLGCGTGRYFWGLRRVESLTGLDASEAMLAEAREPIHAERLANVPVRLVAGDLMTHSFPAGSFDLVYSIGVLAEHVPLSQLLVDRVAGWLRPGGRFAFTTVHPKSPSIPRPAARRLAEAATDVLPAAMTGRLHERLVVDGMYGDERWIARRLRGRLTIESLDRFSTDVHLHGRCVARKPGHRLNTD